MLQRSHAVRFLMFKEGSWKFFSTSNCSVNAFRVPVWSLYSPPNMWKMCLQMFIQTLKERHRSHCLYVLY